MKKKIDKNKTHCFLKLVGGKISGHMVSDAQGCDWQRFAQILSGCELGVVAIGPRVPRSPGQTRNRGWGRDPVKPAFPRLWEGTTEVPLQSGVCPVHRHVLGSTGPCTWLDAAGHGTCTIILSLPEASLRPAGSFLSVTFLLLGFSLGQVLSLTAGWCRSRDGLFSSFESLFLLLTALILWEFHRKIPERREGFH